MPVVDCAQTSEHCRSPGRMDLIHMSMGCHACVIKNVWIHIALATVQYCDGVKAFIATLEFVGILLRHCVALGTQHCHGYF